MTFLTVKEYDQKQAYLEQVWSLLSDSYQNVPGGLHFPSPDAMLEEANEWHLVLEQNTVIALTLYKYKCGRKLVAMAKRRTPTSRQALIALIKNALKHAWMELSDQAELFVMRECNGHQFLIHASLAAKLLNKTIFPSETDGYHYRREIMNLMKTKLLLGTPDLRQVV